MPKYVEWDSLDAKIEECLNSADYGFDNDLLNQVIDILSDPPAADVVPVVRCANCQYFEIVEYWPDGTKKVCRLLNKQVHENVFCSFGCRKEKTE